MKTKRTVVILLALVMVLCMVFTGCQENKPSDYSKAGTYYCDVNGTEYTIVLSEDGKVTLSFGSETASGTYTFDSNSTFAFSFEGQDAPVAATLANGAIRLDYKGTSYTLIPKITYTVKYNVNGASAIPDAQIVNGKVLEKPADPTKNGAVFVGWYLDSAFTAKYDFSAAVTGDITLYARFVSPVEGAAEYDVAFDLGYEGAPDIAPVTTIGGVLYNLPTPEREGFIFAGWWTSAYNTPSKLTAKYEEQVLAADQTLYAVWQTATSAPAVSITEKGVSWNSTGVGKSYSVKITNPDGSERTIPVGTTSYTINFANMVAGDYTVSVTVDGKTGVGYYKNKALQAVTAFKVEGTVLSFNAVENADYYLLTIACGNQYHNHASTPIRLEKGTTAYDFGECDMQVGGINFSVKACADNENDFMSSYSDVHNFEQNLAPVSGITHNTQNETITWAPVIGAVAYDVVIQVEGQEAITLVTAEPVVSVKHYTGNINIKVTPRAKMYNSPAAGVLDYTSTRLPAPQNVMVDGYTVTWDAVAGAAGYTIKVNNKTENVTTNSFTIPADYFPAGAAQYDMVIVANAAAAANNSVESDAIKLVVGNMFGELKYQANTLSWNSVIGAYGYVVTLNDGQEVKVTSASYTTNLTKAGENVFTVRALLDTNGTMRSDALTLKVNAKTVTFNADGGYRLDDINTSEEFKVYLAVGDSVNLAEVVNPGYIFDGWFAGEDHTGTKYENTYTLQTDADVTVYAAWAARTYYVTLSVPAHKGSLKEVGGVLNNNVWTLRIPVTYGGTFKLSTPSSLDDLFAFAGWYSEPDGYGIQYTTYYGESVRNWLDRDDDVILFPKWVEVLSFTELQDGTLSANKGDGASYVSEITIPVSYNGMMVSAVDSFKSTTSMITINIPETVSIITVILDGTGKDVGSVFESCSKLQNVNIYKVEGCKDPKYFSEDGILYSYLNEEQTLAKLEYVPEDRKGVCTLSSKITEIPDYIFQRTEITSITIPANVLSIGKNAFYYCQDLVNVIFEAPAEGQALSLNIQEGAFYYCSELTSIEFPARLQTLAYEYYKENNVTHYDAFYGCSKLMEINIQEGCTTFGSIDGVLTNGVKNEILKFPKSRVPSYTDINGVTTEGTYRVPAGITTIGKSAFKENDFIITLIVPSYVTMIKEEAFRDCDGLVEILFEGTRIDPDLTIERMAFYSIGSTFSAVVLPENLKTMGVGAFGSNSKLKTVTLNSYVSQEAHDAYEQKRQDGTLTEADALYNFAPGAFANVNLNTLEANTTYYVTHLNFGPYVDAFDIGAVFGDDVESVVSDPNNAYILTDSKGIIYNAAQTELLYYPASITGAYVTPPTLEKIASGVFRGKTGLTSITIGKNITHIGDMALYGCKNLVELKFEEGRTKELHIGEYAFRDCEKLIEITLPETTVSIANFAFYHCDELRVINLPSTLRQVGEFEERELNVKNPTTGEWEKKTVSVPKEPWSYMSGSTEIFVNTMDVFYGSYNLTTINVAAGNKYYSVIDGVLYGSEFVEEREVSTTTGEGDDAVTTTTIEYYLHEADGTARVLYYSPVSNPGTNGVITMPATLTRIWNKAFYYNGYTTYSDAEVFAHTVAVTPVNNGMANNKVIMGDEVFYYARSFTNISLPEGLEALRTNCFYGCNQLISIVIPSTVNLIEEKVFQSCTALERVEFLNGTNTTPLETVEGYVVTDSSYGTESASSMFGGCTALKEVILPNRLEKIPGAMFALCTNLTNVNIPASVKEIGSYAFYKCSNLTNINFEEGSRLTAIHYRAFSYTGITDFVIPDTVTTLGSYAFAYSQLQTVKLPTALMDTIATPYSYTYKSSDGKIYTSTPVESQANYAFYQCKSLTTVTMPKYKLLPNSLFYYCGELTTVNLVGEGEMLEVGPYAFGYCYKLENFTIPATVKVIGNYAFRGVPINVVLPESLEEMGYYAFYGNEVITSITIPASVKTIGNYAFSNCINLETVTFADAKSCMLESFGNYVFQNTALKTFTFPENIKEIAVEGSDTPEIVVNTIKIGTNFFSGCKYLTKVVISDSIQSLTNVFTGCASIETFEISDTHPTFDVDPNLPFLVKETANGKEITMILGDLGTKYETLVIPEGYTAIANNVFEKISGLKKIVIPSTMKTIGNYAFSYCYDLEEIEFKVDNELALNLTSIGTYAFQYTPLKSLVLPGVNSPKTIGDYAFRFCDKLEKVDLSNVTSLGIRIFESCTSLKDVDLGNHITKFTGSNTFLNCTALETIVIPDSVTTYNTYLFDGCISLKNVTLSKKANTLTNYMFRNCSSLETIVIPNNVTKYGTYMFQNCTALKNVTLSNNSSASALQNYMFNGCTSLKSINIPGSVKYVGTYVFAATGLESISLPGVTHLGSATSTLSTSTSGYVFKDCADLKTIDMPKVIKIAGYAFQNCTSLESFAFSGTVEQYGTYLFDGCTALKEVQFSSNSKATALTNYMFRGCTALETVVIPSNVEKYGTNMFQDCTSLKDVTLSTNTAAKALTSSMFRGCTALESMVIPAHVTTYSAYLFEGCTNLKEVTLSTKANSLSNYMFQNCTALEKIVIPNNVTAYGTYMFQNCTALKDVTLSTKAKIITTYMFDGCTALTALTIPEVVTTINKAALQDTAIETLHLPKNVATIQAYALSSNELKSITVDSANATFAALPNGALQNKKTSQLVCWPAKGPALTLENILGATGGSFETPDGDPVITEGTFMNCVLTGTLDLSNTGLTVLPKYLFAGVRGENVTLILPNTLQEIADYAFYDCTAFKEIILPDSVTKIGNYAFRYCKTGKIHVGKNVAQIGSSTTGTSSCYTFANAEIGELFFAESALDSMIINTYAFYTSTFNNVYLSELVSKSIYVKSYSFYKSNISGEIVLKADIENASSASYGMFAYAILNKVVLYPEATRIPDYMFYHADIKSIEVPATVEIVGKGAFDCSTLEEIIFLKDENGKCALKELGNSAFDQSQLKSFEFPDTLTTVGTYTFYETQLTGKIVLPEGLTTISNYMFQKCEGITEVVIPNSVTTIGISAFNGCTALKAVQLPGTLEVISATAFSDCTALTSIVIPESVTDIKANAFKNWTEEQTIYFVCEESATASFTSNWNATGATMVFDYKASEEQ